MGDMTREKKLQKPSTVVPVLHNSGCSCSIRNLLGISSPRKIKTRACVSTGSQCNYEPIGLCRRCSCIPLSKGSIYVLIGGRPPEGRDVPQHSDCGIAMKIFDFN